jgi:hypothetical protein
MSPPPDSGDSSPFPMAIACTGCATRYQIDRPRGFSCPHCGNHIQIHQDGKVEIVPKQIMEQELQQIEQHVISSPPSPDPPQTTDSRSFDQAHALESEEPTLEIILGKRKPVKDSTPVVTTAPSPSLPTSDEVDDVADAEMISDASGPDEERSPEQRSLEERSSEQRSHKERSIEERSHEERSLEEQSLEEQIRLEEVRLEKLKKGRELLARKKLEATRTIPVAPPVESQSTSSPADVKSPSSRQESSGVPPIAITSPSSTGAVPLEVPSVVRTQEPSSGSIDEHSQIGRQSELSSPIIGNDPVSPTTAPGGRERLPPPVIQGHRDPTRKPVTLPFDGDLKKNALLAIGIVFLLIMSAVLYSIIITDDFTVTMPPERMGDEGKYNVDGRIWVSSPDGINSPKIGLIQDLEINMNGELWYVLNGTKETTDGFNVTHTTLDTYLYQSLDLSGSVELLGSKTDFSDAGDLKTKTSTYTSLITKETVRTKVFNDLDLAMLSYQLRSIDHGIYYPSGDSSDLNLFDLGDREFSLGDHGDLAAGQFIWNAEEKEKVYKWDCIRLHITENKSDSQWRTFSGDIWVANECSLPVKVQVHTKIDSSKLTPTQQLLFSLFTTTSGLLEVEYSATMFRYTAGDEDIPWDDGHGVDPTIYIRKDAEFNEDWVLAPWIRNDSASFDHKFSPEAAAEYAVNSSTDLKSFVERHRSEVYVVDGEYSVRNGTQYWQMLFGYRASGISTNSQAYNITIAKSGSSLSLYSDPGDEEISNPSNSREEVERAMNIADSENVFRGMSFLTPLFDGDSIDFEDSAKGDITFSIQNNYLHTGLTISSNFNPFFQSTVPAGYGYYLSREKIVGDATYFEEGMIDAQNGKVIYDLDHYQAVNFK